MTKEIKIGIRLILNRVYGTIIPPIKQINQTGPEKYTIEPDVKLSFNDWALLNKVSSKDAERAIKELIDQDEYYILQKLYRNVNENVQESKYSLANIGVYLLGSDRVPFQL